MSSTCSGVKVYNYDIPVHVSCIVAIPVWCGVQYKWSITIGPSRTKSGVVILIRMCERDMQTIIVFMMIVKEIPSCM